MIPLAGSNQFPTLQVIAILLGFLLGFAQSAYGQRNPDLMKSEREFLSSPEEKWSESDEIGYPDAPRDANLVSLDSESIGGPYQIFIDRTSVSMGADGVLRYTVVLKSKSGARNTFYEGIRCATSEYKTYAYATHTGEFRPMASSSWRKLKTTAPYDYRRLLEAHYVCDRHGWALDEEQVQRRIVQSNPARIRHRPGQSGFGPFRH